MQVKGREEQEIGRIGVMQKSVYVCKMMIFGEMQKVK